MSTHSHAAHGADPHAAPGTTGRVLHSGARWYDALAWLMLFGREPAFRDKILDLLRITSGESLLDIGCGTGTLALRAARRVGSAGRVCGIDASPEMIDQARRKARKAGAHVEFDTAVVEALPFADASFDVVSSTLMLHHLPRTAREQCATEIRRVLKPGGRVIVVDFGARAHRKKGLFDHFHPHGHTDLNDTAELLRHAGLTVTESGALGVLNQYFVIATAP